MSQQKTSQKTDKLKGSVKEALGKLIGDESLAAEGRTQQKLPKSDVKPKPTSET